MSVAASAQPFIPHRVPVDHADITLDCDGYIFGEHSLCAAVATEMERVLGALAHADFGGRDGAGGVPLHRVPVVRYRVRGRRPHLHIVGPLAHQHARAVLTHLTALRTPTGDVLPVRPSATLHTTESIGVHRRFWHEYALISPVMPARVAIDRMPRKGAAWALDAWAQAYVTSALTTLLESLGATVAVPLYTRLVDPVIQRVTFGSCETIPAIGGTLVTNARVPDGIGLGARTAFGFGEMRLQRMTESRS